MGRVPKQSRAEVTRARIVQAVIEITLDRGAAAVTTSSLADHTGLSVGSVYRYFATREAAIGEAYDTTYRAMIGDWFASLPVMRDRSAAEAAAIMMKAYVEAASSAPAFLPLLEAVRTFRTLTEQRAQGGMAEDRLARFADMLDVTLHRANRHRMSLLRHLTAELSHLVLLSEGDERKRLHDDTVAIIQTLLERMRAEE